MPKLSLHSTANRCDERWHWSYLSKNRILGMLEYSSLQNRLRVVSLRNNVSTDHLRHLWLSPELVPPYSNNHRLGARSRSSHCRSALAHPFCRAGGVKDTAPGPCTEPSRQQYGVVRRSLVCAFSARSKSWWLWSATTNSRIELTWKTWN